MEKIQNVAKSVQKANDDFLHTKLLVRARHCNIISDTIGNKHLSQPEKEMRENKDDDDDDIDEDDKLQGYSMISESQNVEKETTKNGGKSRESYSSPSSQKSSKVFLYHGTPGEITIKSALSHFEIVRESDGLKSLVGNLQIKSFISESLKTGLEAKYLQFLQFRAPPVYPPDPAQSQQWPRQWAHNILESGIYKRWAQQNERPILYLHGRCKVSGLSHALSECLESLDQAAERESDDEPRRALYFEFNRRDLRFKNIDAMLTFFINVLASQFPSCFNRWQEDALKRMHHNRCWVLHHLFDMLYRKEFGKQSFVIGSFDECDRASRVWFLRTLGATPRSENDRVSWIIASKNNKDITADISQLNTIDLDMNTLADVAKYPAMENKLLDPTPTFSESDRSLEQDILFCVQYAVRSLTICELSIMVSLHDSSDNCSDHQTKELLGRIMDPSNSLVYLQHDEVHLRQLPAEADLLESTKAHADLAKRCLQYLRDPAIQEEIKELCHNYNRIEDVPISLPRHNLIVYAVMFWASHYRLSG